MATNSQTAGPISTKFLMYIAKSPQKYIYDLFPHMIYTFCTYTTFILLMVQLFPLKYANMQII